MGRTILGRVGARPTTGNPIKLAAFTAASATSIGGFFDADWANKYETILIHGRGLEKPSTPANGVIVVLSSNGATFETTAGQYIGRGIGNSSATVVAADGFSAAQWDVNFSIAVSSLATATSFGGGDIYMWLTNPASSKVRIQSDYYFFNSASTPTMRTGFGHFSTGPIRGAKIELVAGGNISGALDVWGMNSPR